MNFGPQTKSYSAYINPPDLLVYRKLITHVHTARGSFWSHSLAAIAASGISITYIDFPLGFAAPGGLTSGSATVPRTSSYFRAY